MTDLAHPEAERAVLAAFLLDPATLREHAADLRDADFAVDRHQLIYRAIAAVQMDGQPVDERTVQAELERRGEFEKAGGVTYLAALDMDLPDLNRVRTYIRIVKDSAIRRRLVLDLRKTVVGVESGAYETTKAISEATKAVGAANGAVAVDELLPVDDGLERILHRIENPTADLLTGITTGFDGLDRLTMGISPGQLVILAGRPGMGKTALAFCMARAALVAGIPGIFFSLEMNREELQVRMVSAVSSVEFWRIKTGHMSRDQAAAVRAAVATVARWPLCLQSLSSLTVGKLEAMIRQARRQYGIKWAMVDYLGIMEPDPAENRNLQLAGVSRNLKRVAGELEIPLVALHQLKRQEGRPILSDLRDSGAIEQDADTAIFIYRQQKGAPLDKDAPPMDQAELIVAKQRNGDTGSIFVRQELRYFRFDSMDEAQASQKGIF